MTDPMELVGRAEHFDGAHKRGCEGRSWACTCGDDETAMNLIAQMAACIREMVEWRPIETAPRDGTEIIAMIARKRVRLAWYFKPSSRTEGWLDENGREIIPTHWLPLPPSPGAEA